MKKTFIIALALQLSMIQGARGIDEFSDVDGTTITIHSIAEMTLLAQNVNSGTNYSGYTFLLATDLAYDGTVGNYTVIGNTLSHKFCGTFDGQGHTISGINLSSDGVKGLFGYVNEATVKNVRLTSSTFNATSAASAGSIVGNASEGITIENCHASESVTISSKNVCGGIIGLTDKGNVAIIGCSSGASLSVNTDLGLVGGIVGRCGHDGSGSDQTYVNIYGCLYFGSSLTAYPDKAGGIVGYYYTTEGSIALQSTVLFENNYYTYPNASVKAAGGMRKSNGATYQESGTFDIIDKTTVGLRVRPVTTTDDIADMEDVLDDITYPTDLIYHQRGVETGGHSYSHVLALPNNAAGTELIAQYAGQTFDVKLRGRRFYKDDSWNTICLPFNLIDFKGTPFQSTEDSRCYVCEMDVSRSYYLKVGDVIDYSRSYRTGLTDGKLYLFFKDDNRDFTAGKPFIVKWDKPDGYTPTTAAYYDIFDPIFPNATIADDPPAVVTSQDGIVSLRAIYAPVAYSIANRSILFVGAANTLYYPSGAGTVTLNAYRAYFELNGVAMAEDPDSETDDDEFVPEGGGNVKPFIISIEDNPTATADVNLNERRMTKNHGLGESIYNLAGQKVNGKRQMANGKSLKGKLPKGIYIVGGRKEVLK